MSKKRQQLLVAVHKRPWLHEAIRSGMETFFFAGTLIILFTMVGVVITFMAAAGFIPFILTGFLIFCGLVIWYTLSHWLNFEQDLHKLKITE